MKSLLRWLLSSAFISVSSSAIAAGCEGLPPPSHDTIFEPAKDYATSNEQSLDADGIVVFDYKSDYSNLGKWPNPFFNSSYALALYRDWLNTECSDDELKKKFLHHAEWFAKTHTDKDGMAVWTYPFYNGYFGVPAGWYSGIGQAAIAGVLFRAYAVSGESKYKTLAERAIEVYFRPMSEGGVITEEDGDLWIQEVPTTGQPSNILNGHDTAIFTLMDIRDTAWPDKRIDALIKRGIDTVRHNIASFDAGFLSFYSQHLRDGKVAQMAERLGYNDLHVTQLLNLYKIDGDPIFLDWAMRFQAYDDANDPRTAMGSVDPIDHGPGEAAGRYMNHYWSHAMFPTWYDVTLKHRDVLDGVFIEAQTDAATPKDFTVSTYLDDARREHAVISGNKDRQVYLHFKEPVMADKIRLDINSDNGNNNVALVAVMPIRHNIQRGPVADACNHRMSSGIPAIWSVFDDNPATRFTLFCDGYIFMPPLNANGRLEIKLAEGPGTIRVETSSDLKSWQNAGEITPANPAKRSLAIPSGVYTKIDLQKTLIRIDGITYEAVLPQTEAVKEEFIAGFRNASR